MGDSDYTWFSLRRFALAVVAVGIGAAAGMVYVPVVGTQVGMLLGAFATGLASEERPLLEGGIAGVLAGLGALLASKLIGNGIIGAILGLLSINPQTLLVSVAISFAVGTLGAHFGNDLREGLSEPIDDFGRQLDGL